ncbi:MAG: GTP-binding protein [Clostridia bacterium]|nr:GTP-binding protein [Clostridia bacterium]
MKILIVSGFLGAGKTTFIKELIRKTGQYMVVMENEFGETDLDSQELSKQNGLEVMEFMDGCVCCSMKDSFVNSVMAVSASLDPEYLVVEPTGVAKLGNILENMNLITYERISLLRPVVILTPRSYLANLNEFPDIYLDQLKNASIIVFSKAENDTREELEEVIAHIRTLNTEAEIITELYANLDPAWWKQLLIDENERETVRTEDEALDLDEITVRHGEMGSLGELVAFLEDVLRGRLGAIVRAKGVMRVAGEFLRFDLADRMYAVIAEDAEDPKPQSVYIGRELAKDELYARLHTEAAREQHDHHHDHGPDCDCGCHDHHDHVPDCDCGCHDHHDHVPDCGCGCHDHHDQRHPA